MQCCLSLLDVFLPGHIKCVSFHIHCGALVPPDIIWVQVCDLVLDPVIELTWKETLRFVSYSLLFFWFLKLDKTRVFIFYLEGHELKGTYDGCPACRSQGSPDDHRVSSKPLCVSQRETSRNASAPPSGCSSSRGSSPCWHTFTYIQTWAEAMNWHKTSACTWLENKEFIQGNAANTM